MKTIERLNDFVDWYKDYIPMVKGDRFYKFDVEAYRKDDLLSVKSNFQHSSPRDYIGVSSLYRNIILLGLQKLGFPHPINLPTIKNKIIFHFGNTFENVIVRCLESYGLPLTETQKEVLIPDTSIKGHIDGIIGDTLIEIKTMSGSYFRSFTKNPNNLRGYLTQVSVYSQCLGLSNVCFLCFNKETSDIELVEIPIEEILKYWTFAYEKAQQLESINTIEDLMSLPFPNPSPEVFKGEETGKHLVPQSFKYSPYVNAWCNLSTSKNNYGKMTTYVDSVVNDYKQIKHRLLSIKENIEEYDITY